MARAEAIARYLLYLASASDESCPITHMQLQKLMYYVQGWSLAATGKPAFPGRIEAWEHGPVVKAVYPKFADYKGRPIAQREATDEGHLGEHERALVESVWSRYGRYSAPQLRTMTHSEPPWKDARGGLAEGEQSDALISEASMKEYFTGVQRRHCARMGIEPGALAKSVRHARAGKVTELELPRGRGRVAR